ncbi:NHLP bacteriocin export ABC transporter permease/ATPase subunit [Streptomyces hirsutus]
MDLFAVDAEEQGHWHHTGPAGGGLAAARSGGGAAAHAGGPPAAGLRGAPDRPARAVYRGAGTQTWSYDEYGTPQYVPPTSSPLEYALALGVGRNLSVLFQAPMATEGTAAPGDDDVFWMQVPPGSVQYGSLYGPRRRPTC